MVRIKVYRASQVLAVAAAVLLGIVLASLLVSYLLGGRDTWSTSSQAAVEVAAAFSVNTPVIPLAPQKDRQSLTETEDIIVEVIHRDAASSQPRPRILVYHTHTHEAYAQVENDPYDETEAWRTADREHSVVRVGDALCELLNLRGVEAFHDITDHEASSLSTAYTRSLQTLENYKEQHFDLCIDLHRDAFNDALLDFAEIGAQQMAQLMMLVGDGGDYASKPDYAGNLRFAIMLTEDINQRAPGLCREVMVKNGRYNQHLFTPSILIEVGHNRNTLEQALASMSVLADSLAALLTDI